MHQEAEGDAAWWWEQLMQLYRAKSLPSNHLQGSKPEQVCLSDTHIQTNLTLSPRPDVSPELTLHPKQQRPDVRSSGPWLGQKGQMELEEALADEQLPLWRSLGSAGIEKLKKQLKKQIKQFETDVAELLGPSCCYEFCTEGSTCGAFWYHPLCNVGGLGC